MAALVPVIPLPFFFALTTTALRPFQRREHDPAVQTMTFQA
ncbi:hypothetical protein [Microvirga arvi]|nr:hypothetical protein [Microvirga arvi]